jgi:hypothetical protein
MLVATTCRPATIARENAWGGFDAAAQSISNQNPKSFPSAEQSECHRFEQNEIE